MVPVLMIIAKLATLGLFKIKLLQDKDGDVIISVHDMSPTLFYHMSQTIL